MKEENGEMVLDEDREAVEISRDSRESRDSINRETVTTEYS